MHDRRGFGNPWIAAVLLGAGLAGCLDDVPSAGAGAGRGGPGGSGATDAALAAGLGGISGTVLNPEGAWIPHALVVLVGGASRTGDAQGRFAFLDIAPGAYLVRATADGYVPLERPANVVAGAVAQVELVLDPGDDEGPGSRFHFHDFWGNATEKPLFEKTIEWPVSAARGGRGLAGCAEVRTDGAFTGTSDLFRDIDFPTVAASLNERVCGLTFYLEDLPGDDDAGTDREEIVWPATREIEATVSWDRQDFVDQVQFLYQPANNTTFVALPGSTLGSGGRFVLPIQSPMNDHGHQTYSLWAFKIQFEFQLAGKPVPPLKQSELVRELVGDFDVQMVARRGVLDPEPPHPRFWAGGDRLALAPPLWLNITAGPRLPRDPTARGGGVGFGLPPGAIVPPGTTHLDMALEYWTSPPTDAAVDVDPWLPKRTLTFRTAALNPRLAAFSDYRHDAPDVNEAPVGNGPGRAQWRLALDPERELDAYYQPASVWYFAVASEGHEDEDTFVNECYERNGCGGIHLRLAVEAFNANWARDFGPADG